MGTAYLGEYLIEHISRLNIPPKLYAKISDGNLRVWLATSTFNDRTYFLGPINPFEVQVGDVYAMIPPRYKNSGYIQLVYARAGSEPSLDCNLSIGLKEREIEVLELIAKGLPSEMIAKLLHLSKKTVKGYLSSVYDKLGIKGPNSITRAALFYISNIKPHKTQEPFALQYGGFKYSADNVKSLTPRQYEISTLIGQGLSNQQIAITLGISEKTVKQHVSQILDKFGVLSRLHAALIILQYQNELQHRVGQIHH